MSFEMYMEREIPGYKSLITEDILIELKDSYENMNEWRKTRDYCNKMLSKDTSLISWQNDFDKADKALEFYTGKFYEKILKVKEQLGLLSQEEENRVSYK